MSEQTQNNYVNILFDSNFQGVNMLFLVFQNGDIIQVITYFLLTVEIKNLKQELIIDNCTKNASGRF